MKIDPANLDFRRCHHLLAGAIVPRPVALISTVSEDGIFNVAPFSSINIAGIQPPLVVFEVSTRRDGRKKDTIRNIEFAKEFVVNIPLLESFAEAMNHAGFDFPPEVDEFKETGLTPVKADMVKVPMVGEAPVNFECRLVKNLEFGQFPRISNLVIGEVVLAHIKDGLYVDGGIQSTKLKPIGRLLEPYCRTTDVFELKVEYEL